MRAGLYARVIGRDLLLDVSRFRKELSILRADPFQHQRLFSYGQTARQNWWLEVAITGFVIVTDAPTRTLVETLLQVTRLVEVSIQ